MRYIYIYIYICLSPCFASPPVFKQTAEVHFFAADSEVTCIKGSAIPNYSACLSPCLLAEQTVEIWQRDDQSYHVASGKRLLYRERTGKIHHAIFDWVNQLFLWKTMEHHHVING